MKLTVLLDNNTLIDRYFLGEPGVSYLIEDEGTTVLFDVGYSDAFLRNAQKMHINLLDTDFIILSHGHLDHTWGLVPLIWLFTEASVEREPFDKPALITHPDAFSTRKVEGLAEIGSVISREKLAHHFEMRLSKEPVWLNERLVFLGEIERTNDFEGGVPIGKTVGEAAEEDDYLNDDSALVYTSSQGLVIITGCAHAGICNTVEYAKKVCGESRIVDIIGGFHLLDPPQEQLRRTLDYFRGNRPGSVHAAHCTDLRSKIALSSVVDLEEVGVGLRVEYES